MILLKKIAAFIWSKKFAINFGILVILYVSIFVCLKWYLNSTTVFGEKIEVPNLIGKNQNNLNNIMASSLLEIEVLDSVYDPSKIEGTIIEQDPTATSITDIYVKHGRKIKVRVSKRTQLVEMPGLVDKSQRFAEGILRNRSFKYKVEYQPSQEAHGAVIEQLYKRKSIAKGTKIPIGSTIKLIVGRNEVGVELPLPNLYGLTIVEAKERVESLMNTNIIVSCPDCETKADSLTARVQSQSPEYSDEAVIASGGAIIVYASKAFEESPE